MLDIMRYQFRQLLRSRTALLLSFLVFAVFFVLLFLTTANYGEPRDFMTSVLPETLPLIAVFSSALPGIYIGIACGDDLADKTINHELTAGRSRAASLLGRAVPALIFVPLMTAALCGLPFVLYGILYGAGDTIPLSAIALRFLLMLFPLMRLSAFFILLIFIVKKQIVSIVSVMVITPIAFSATSGSSTSVLLETCRRVHGMLSISDFINLSAFESWRTYDLKLNVYFTYYPELSASQIALTVICSLVMTAVYLLLSYHYFHVDDMN